MTAAAPARAYLNPLGFVYGPAAAAAISAGDALPVACSGIAFTCGEILRRDHHGTISQETVSARELVQSSPDPELSALIARTCGPRAPFQLGGTKLSFDHPKVMGVVNVTPDSFSGDGVAGNPEVAIAHGRHQIEASADLIDIGGESTRPGAAYVDPEEECDRVLPVISALKDLGVPISVDTRRAKVMTAAISAGATIINDVSALSGDPDSLSAAAASGAAVILNHMRGTPQDMQDDPIYTDVLLDVFDELEQRIEASMAAGIPRERLIVDPGLGFGKSLEHNLRLMANLALFQGLGCPVLIGASRKSFIGAISGSLKPESRLPGSLAAALGAVRRGANMVRVHDVAATRQAMDVSIAVDGRN